MPRDIRFLRRLSFTMTYPPSGKLGTFKPSLANMPACGDSYASIDHLRESEARVVPESPVRYPLMKYARTFLRRGRMGST